MCKWHFNPFLYVVLKYHLVGVDALVSRSNNVEPNMRKEKRVELRARRTKNKRGKNSVLFLFVAGSFSDQFSWNFHTALMLWYIRRWRKKKIKKLDGRKYTYILVFIKPPPRVWGKWVQNGWGSSKDYLE